MSILLEVEHFTTYRYNKPVEFSPHRVMKCGHAAIAASADGILRHARRRREGAYFYRCISVCVRSEYGQTRDAETALKFSQPREIRPHIEHGSGVVQLRDDPDGTD